MNRLSLASSLLVLAAGTGCGKVSSEDVAARASRNTRALVTEAGGASTAVNGSAIRVMFESFDALNGGLQAPSTEPAPDPITSPEAPPQSDFDQAAERLARYLEERVFTEEQLESSDSKEAVFLLKGENVCTDGSIPADPQCVSQVNLIVVRLRAELVGKDGVALTLLIGPARHAALTLELLSDALAVQVDLAQAKLAVEHIAQVNGESATGLPRLMQGVVELRVKKNGEQDFTFSTSVLAQVKVEVEGADGDTTFSTAPKSPLSAVRLDAKNRRVGVDVDLGHTEVSVPYSTAAAPRTAGQRLTYSLSGASFFFTAEEGQTDFAIGHVSLGDARSSVSLDGKVLFTADLNEQVGRAFDLQLTQDANGLPLVKVQPELDLVAMFNLAPLTADPEVTVESHLLDETYRLRLAGGAVPTVQPIAADDATGFRGGLKVISGALSLETNQAGVDKVVVNAGECLTRIAEPAAGAHPLLGALQAVACP